MTTLSVFNDAEYEAAMSLLSAKVATMIGRKMEEDDWDFVYCNAKQIPRTSWSNLDIDINHCGLGVEHKMLRVLKKGCIKDVCGTTLMHPSATRSIRIDSAITDPNVASKEVLKQYADLIGHRRNKVRENSPDGEADMRTGWLLWKDMLDEFLYFEEQMVEPDPDAYYADWNETPARGSRKATKSLWIYERDTGKKKFSVTTSAGAKIQPYFDVPSPTDMNLYYFKVQGRILDGGLVEVWVTKSTAKYLELMVGSLEPDVLSAKFLSFSPVGEEHCGEFEGADSLAVPIVVSTEAYDHLKSCFEYVSDEKLIQDYVLSI